MLTNPQYNGKMDFYKSVSCLESSNQSIYLGGALTNYQSTISFNGTSTLQRNMARRGGALLATESFIYVYGQMAIASNVALDDGGGAYVYQSYVTVANSNCVFADNQAHNDGGGIHAISSILTITIDTDRHKSQPTQLHFINNLARQGGGGGLYLKANSKLYVIK